VTINFKAEILQWLFVSKSGLALSANAPKKVRDELIAINAEYHSIYGEDLIQIV
jgi:adenine C2-methylase RlmN of 23S rRNA A2503 and tRNA A37